MNKMKIAAALGLAVAGFGVSTAASAQDYNGYHRGYDQRDDRGDRRDYRDNRRNYRDDRRDWRNDNRGYYGYNNGYGYGYGHRGNCHIERRHHHRVTVCYR